MDSRSLLVVVSMLVCCVAGCGDGGESFPEVKLDPAEIAAAVMAEYDANTDGELSKSELKKCKGLEMMTVGQSMLLPELRLDKDENGKISEEEFTQKFAECFNDLRQGYSCTVVYRGQPLEGATVTLVPEPFMGSTVSQASGETDSQGNCSVSSDDGLSGAVPGIYRVEITHPDVKIPAKFNTASKISIALDPTNPYAQPGVPTHNIR